jgi:hypothetical protein
MHEAVKRTEESDNESESKKHNKTFTKLSNNKDKNTVAQKLLLVLVDTNHLSFLFRIYGAIWKLRGLAAVRRCYPEGGSDSYVKL